MSYQQVLRPNVSACVKSLQHWEYQCFWLIELSKLAQDEREKAQCLGLARVARKHCREISGFMLENRYYAVNVH